MTVLIPAYELNERLIKLISDLKSICDYHIVIVDDGSGDSFSCIPGDRFEYEMNMLIDAGAAGYDFHEVDINTVYLIMAKPITMG